MIGVDDPSTVPPEFPSLPKHRKALTEFVLDSRVGSPVVADKNNIERTKNKGKWTTP